MPKELDEYRTEFPVTESQTYLNHAAISPVSNRVVQAVESVLEDYKKNGSSCYPQWVERIEAVRNLFARLIQVDPSEIAFVGNTSEGLSLVAAGLDWKPGDEILVPKPDFPTNIYPWMNLKRRGVTAKFFNRKDGRFSIGEIERVISPRTRLLSVTSVDFATGFRCDLQSVGDLCRRKGILFCVDAIQGLGVLPMDAKRYGIHFLAAGGHKWLLSAVGCGCLYVSKDADPHIHPEAVGWKSVVDEEDFFRIHFDLKPNALRFEPGTMNILGIFALGAALELLFEVGTDRIYDQVLTLNERFQQGLLDRGDRVVSSMTENERSGILSFVPREDPRKLFDFLTQNSVSVSLREDMIRLSPHFYNNQEDIRRFFDLLDEFRS
jgi:selenocysteine lyase/cysteine desulfurase